MIFAEMTAPRLAAVDKTQAVVLLPIAAVEQHGPHLPTGTDAIICEAVARAVEARLPKTVLLLPSLWVGASAHHLRWGATLTAELATYIALLCEHFRPLVREGYRRFVYLNGHGGNIDPMKVALRQLQAECPAVLLAGACYWTPADAAIRDGLEGEDKFVGHACEFETSMIMHLRPDLVDSERVAHAGEWVRDDLHGLHLCRDMKQRTQAGCTGRPDLASAAKGKRLFAAVVDDVSTALTALQAEPIPA